MGEDNKEISQDELVNKVMVLEAQLQKEQAINQKLREHIGRSANELAHFQVGFDDMHQHAKNLEKQLEQTPPKNAAKGGKTK